MTLQDASSVALGAAASQGAADIRIPMSPGAEAILQLRQAVQDLMLQNVRIQQLAAEERACAKDERARLEERLDAWETGPEQDFEDLEHFEDFHIL